MIVIRARNKIIEGKYKEYSFRIKRGQIYIFCLEREIAINRMLIYSIEEINYIEQPKMMSMLARGYLGTVLLGTLGMIAGISTADRRGIHRVLIKFFDGQEAIAEVDDGIFNKLLIL